MSTTQTIGRAALIILIGWMSLLALGALLSGYQYLTMPKYGSSVILTPVALAPVTAMWLDADTANEMDDLYAVAHVVADPAVELLALSSSHFNNTEIGTKDVWHGYDTVAELGRGLDTVESSQRENEELMRALGADDVPMPLGASEMIGYSWGYFEGAPVPEAPAVDALIARARVASSDAKLDVAAVGPLTNVAAALIQAPDIASNIRVWWLGAGYHADTGVWNKNRFNVRNDLNAADYLLDRNDVELIMMPTEVARELMFDRERTTAALARIDHLVARDLLARWDFVRAQGEWTMWDMALTLAMAHPEWADAASVPAPPENMRESVTVITDIDGEAMEAHFFEVLGVLE